MPFSNLYAPLSVQGSSQSYVESMIEEVLPSAKLKTLESELREYCERRADALDDPDLPKISVPSAPASKYSSSNVTNPSVLDAVGAVFVGNMVRLFIPNDTGGVYHVGRIIDFRRHVKPFVASSTNPKSSSGR